MNALTKASVARKHTNRPNRCLNVTHVTNRFSQEQPHNALFHQRFRELYDFAALGSPSSILVTIKTRAPASGDCHGVTVGGEDRASIDP